VTHETGRGSKTSPSQVYQDDVDKIMSGLQLTEGMLFTNTKRFTIGRMPFKMASDK
jgi:hypothetical protein